MPDALVARQHGLSVPERRGRTVQLDRQQPSIARSFLPFAERFAPDEVLGQPNREAQPHLVRIVEGSHVMPPRPEPAFQPEPIERESAGMTEVEIFAGLHDPVVQIRDELGRHVQLPAELARVGHAERPRLRPAGLDPAGRQERERVVGQIGVGQALQQLP